MSITPLTPEPGDQEALMSQVAYLYYEEMLTQEAIARRLQVTRWKVGRLLRAAREQGIVEISIRHVDSRSVELEQKIVELFGLDDKRGGQQQMVAVHTVDRTAHWVANQAGLERGLLYLTVQCSLRIKRLLGLLVGDKFQPNE